MHLLALALVLAQAAAPAAPKAAEPLPQPAPGGPVVALEVAQGRTVFGTITIALDPEKAPISVRNFLTYVRAGHYDGTVFHRVMQGFMIQGGGYTPELEEKPTQPPDPERGQERPPQLSRHGRHGSDERPRQRHQPVLHQPEGQPHAGLRDQRGGLRRLRPGHRGDGRGGQDRGRAHHEPGFPPERPQMAVVIKKAREVKATADPAPAPAPKPAAQPAKP